MWGYIRRLMIVAFTDEAMDSSVSVHSQFLSSNSMSRAFFIVRCCRLSFLLPGAVKFLCYGHLGIELFVDFTSKISAMIKGYYACYFSVAKKVLVQTASRIDCSVSCAWCGLRYQLKLSRMVWM